MLFRAHASAYVPYCFLMPFTPLSPNSHKRQPKLCKLKVKPQIVKFLFVDRLQSRTVDRRKLSC